MLAKDFLGKYDRLDVLVNNAGVLMGHRTVTENGLETAFSVNRLYYFQLAALRSNRLLETAPSRVVNLVSIAHERGRFSFEDLQGEK